MQKWELWIEKYTETVDGKTVEGEDYHFFPVDEETYEKNIRLAGVGARHIWTVEAHDYNDAQKKYHAYMGWGEYKPMDDDAPET